MPRRAVAALALLLVATLSHAGGVGEGPGVCEWEAGCTSAGGGGTTLLGCWFFSGNTGGVAVCAPSVGGDSSALVTSLANCDTDSLQTNFASVARYWPSGTNVTRVEQIVITGAAGTTAGSDCQTTLSTLNETTAPTTIAGLSFNFPTGGNANGTKNDSTVDVTLASDAAVVVVIDDGGGTCAASGTGYDTMTCAYGTWP